MTGKELTDLYICRPVWWLWWSPKAWREARAVAKLLNYYVRKRIA